MKKTEKKPKILNKPLLITLILIALIEWLLVLKQLNEYTVLLYVIPYVVIFYIVTRNYRFQTQFIIALLSLWICFFTPLILAFFAFDYMNPVFAIISIFVPLVITPIVILLYVMLREL